MGARAGLDALCQGGSDGKRGGIACRVIHKGDGWFYPAALGNGAAGGLDDIVIGPMICLGSAVTVSGDGAMDQLGIDIPQNLVAHTKCGQRASGVILDDDIGVFGEGLEQFNTCAAAQVQREAAFVGTLHLIVKAQPCGVQRIIWPTPARAIGIGGVFDFDDIRGQKRQLIGAEWPCQHMCEVQYFYAFQCACHLGKPCDAEFCLIYKTCVDMQDIKDRAMSDSSVFHRDLHSDLPVVVGGDGNYLIDETGRRYLDACGGAAVSCLGHDHPKVREAIKAQVDQLAFAHTGSFTNQPAEDLAAHLVARAPEGTGAGRVMYLGSGSEAMEAALKLARQYCIENGQPERRHIIARKPSYHGNTLGALATGGHAGRRAPFAPLLIEVNHIDAPYPYRLQDEGESEADFALRMADLLDAEIQRLGPETVMAFVAEPVVGASLGTQPAPKGYYKRIREICDAHGVLLIADEVMSGMGRTGTTYALEQEGIAADLTTMAKGLGAGYQPIAAVLAAQKVVDVIKAGSGKLWNGHTYMSHAIATAGALAVQRVIEDEKLLDNVKTRGAQLEAGLRTALAQHPHVGDIRGRGLFWTVEVVADRATKAPFDAREGIAMKIGAAAKARGVMTYPSQGCIDGTLGDHVLLAPSYTSSAAEIDLIVETLTASVVDILGQ